MTNATEVILSDHVADETNVDSSDQPSPQYHELRVTEHNRIVRFWNTARYRDISIGRTRRVFFGIEVNQREYWFPGVEYVSPMPLTFFVPWSDEIVVPDDENDSYIYAVKTLYKVEEAKGGGATGGWNNFRSGGTSRHDAAVREAP